MLKYLFLIFTFIGCSNEKQPSLANTQEAEGTMALSGPPEGGDEDDGMEILKKIIEEEPCAIFVAMLASTSEGFSCIERRCSEDIHALCNSGCLSFKPSAPPPAPHCEDIFGLVDQCREECNATPPNLFPLFRQPEETGL